MMRQVAATVTALVLGVSGTIAQAGSHAAPELRFAEVVEVGPDLRMVVGREIDLQNGQIDVASSLLYKVGSTLVVIDSGATDVFRNGLDTAASQLEPYDDVVLVSTHGHADHVGNNAWIDTLGVPSRHVISGHDLQMMRDQVGYFAGTLGRPFAQKIVDLFGGLSVDAESLSVFESLPLETIDIGDTAWLGWSLLDGEVQVLRSAGHTTGHVVVYLKAARHLHLGDETTGWYQAFSDGTHAGPPANLLTLRRASKAVASGAVATITDGHSFAVQAGEAAAARLGDLVDAAIDYDAVVSRILSERAGAVSVEDLVTAVTSDPALAGVPGGPTNPYSFMQMVNKLREMGVGRPVNRTAPIAFPN